MAAMHTTRFSRLKLVMIVTIAAVLLFALFRVILHQTIARQLQTAVQAIPDCTGIRYARLTIPYFSLQCKIHDASLAFAGTGDEIPIRMIHLRRFRPGDQLPQALDVTLYGVRIESRHPLVAPLKQSVRRLGYHALAGDLHLQLERRGEDKKEWAIHLALQIAEAGGVTLSMQLDNLREEGVLMALASPLNWLLVLPPVKLVQGTIIYEDRGLYERALGVAAREHQRRPDQIRDTLLNHLRRQSQTEKDPGVRAVWDSLADFCQNPKRITLQTRIPRPMPLGQLLWMRQPRDFIGGLSIESTTD